jgi:hypothetical protein
MQGFKQKKGAGFWNNVENRKTFLDELGHKLGFKMMDDWYSISHKQIKENGGLGLLDKYNNSPSKLIVASYPTHQWMISHFNTKRRLPESYWENKINRITLIKELAQKLHIYSLEDWYRISMDQIAQVHSHMVVFKKYSLGYMLQETYPNFKWNQAMLQFKYNKASQRWLHVIIQRLFPLSGTF